MHLRLTVLAERSCDLSGLQAVLEAEGLGVNGRLSLRRSMVSRPVLGHALGQQSPSPVGAQTW